MKFQLANANHGLAGMRVLYRMMLISLSLPLWMATPRFALFAQPAAFDVRSVLRTFDWLDNRDYDWYAGHIPALDTPDEDINKTYYYRWDLITKHVVYGSPDDGYAFTEFLDRPFWSGTYGAISCPAGHQLYELRWLRNPRWAEDYIDYWLEVPGAEPRRYSCWLADASWAVHQVHPNPTRLKSQYAAWCRNFEGWREKHWVSERGLFWQTGHDDGMEWNINSRQTKDEIRGAPGFRPTLNAYLWADARALARMARLAEDRSAADEWERFAAQLKQTMQIALWDPKREFFFHQARDDEELEGHVVRAGSLTYQTGRFAGSPHGRELIGYVPWQFSMPDAGFESAWKFLMDPNYFAAPFGPTTVERRDPLFKVQTRCCMWSGMSWPYATSQTLKAMANLLHFYQQPYVTRDDYFKLLKTYSITHRKDGVPYLAEACHPDTGSWEGHDSFYHSEHYFHSSYIDLIVTGLCGLQPQDDDRLVVDPLVPGDWDYFLLRDVPYKGRRISLMWDRHGNRYGGGTGFQVFVDDQCIAQRDQVERIEIAVESRMVRPLEQAEIPRNFAVNNSGRKWPRAIASVDPVETPAESAFDGQYWYMVQPGNRWTNAGSSAEIDWIGTDFGTDRQIEEVVAYFLDDGAAGPARVPTDCWLEVWIDGQWQRVESATTRPSGVVGRAATRWRIEPVTTSRVRLVARSADEQKTLWGISELETWGRSTLPLPQPVEMRSLAFNDGNRPFPRASASHTSRFDRVAELNDGIIRQRSRTQRNRWTAYESPHSRDWIEIDFGGVVEFNSIDLYFYDDGGGVRLPQAVTILVFSEDQQAWRQIPLSENPAALPRGATTYSFERTSARKLRMEFQHHETGKTGVTEWEVFLR